MLVMLRFTAMEERTTTTESGASRLACLLNVQSKRRRSVIPGDLHTWILIEYSVRCNYHGRLSCLPKGIESNTMVVNRFARMGARCT